MANATTNASTNKPLKFGIWVEPEMVNLNSTLYNEHPDWILHSGKHARTLTRNQFVLNVGLPEVQNFIIETVSKILDSATIRWVTIPSYGQSFSNTIKAMLSGIITEVSNGKNMTGIFLTVSAMHELSRPSDSYQYILGLYRVIDTLTQKYPDVLWEGCASGGGRFDAGS